MPILQRIELANFMNSRREKPWRPDWPHQILEINGENAALNIPNGRGKSTMITAILAMLTYHGRSLKDIRTRFFAPMQTGHFTHIRIQILIPMPGASGDLVTEAGGEVGGQPMVFGMYGYSGENEKLELYAYQGKFENCPVAHVHNLHHSLVADDLFLGQMKTCQNLFPSNHKERSKRAWLAFVEDFFDMSSLNQQLIYQLMRGAEGGHSYFDVKPPVGMNYSAAIFYERLAPELLTNVMGELGEEGEHGIEDTIHEKVSKVIAARRETERKAEELSRSEKTLKELGALLETSSTLAAARQEYQKHQRLLSIELAVLTDVVVDNPIPGIPKTPPEGIPEIAKSMVMQEGKWYLPDRVMAEFSGEPASDVNRRAHERNGLPAAQANRSQLIDFPCHSFSVIGKRGPAGSLYPRESAIGLLKVMSNFTRSWTRDSALDAVARAFEWVEAHGDTNPARQLWNELNAELQTKEGEHTTFSDQYRGLQIEKDDLVTEQSTVVAQQAEYRRMADSGLFSADELERPSETGKQVAEAFRLATKDLDTHRGFVRDLKTVHEMWLAFVNEFGDAITPADQATLLTDTRTKADQALAQAKSQLATARGQKKSHEVVKRDADKVLTEIDGKLKRFLETWPATIEFAKVFGDVSPVGLERAVIQDRDEAKTRLATIVRERSHYRAPLEALSSFTKTHGEGNPEEWLRQRLARWEELGREIVSLQRQLDDANRRLAAFDKAVIVAGHVAREAADVAGGNHLPLHAAIAEMRLDDVRRERALTLFSALLHTPVYRTVAEAADAAQRLAAANIEAPVFFFAELESFCKTAEISADAVAAHTWLIGVRTRQVDCLLDPSLVEREKAIERERIAGLIDAIKTTAARRSGFSPENAAAAQVRSAVEAVKQRYPAKDASLALEQDEITAKLPNLEACASPDMLDTIRKTLRHRNEFNRLDEAALREQHAVASVVAEKAEETLLVDSELIETLEATLDTAQQTVGNATIAATRVGDLKRIQAYVDHPERNPVFMDTADDRERILAKANEDADNRTRFQFELAGQFITKGYDRPKQIEVRLTEIKDEQKEIQDNVLPSLAGRIQQIRDHLLVLIQQVGEVDDFTRRLIARYRNFAAEKDELIPVTREQIQRHALWGAIQTLREESALESLIRMIKDVGGDILYEDTAEIGKVRILAKSAFDNAKGSFSQLIDQMQKTADLDMSEHVRIELERAKEQPEIVDHLYAVAKQNHEKNNAANATAAAYLDREWHNLGKWLKAFTLRLPDNLRTMKEVFGPVKDGTTGEYVGAGFELEATLVDQDDIKAVLDDVVRKVEKFEATRHAIESAAPNLRDQAVRGIRDEIRSTFYQKVITNPRIRVFMPSISKHPLPLEKNMVSTGQGVAMTLLWIVKMADYITERELRRMATNRVQQKHLRPTQFALMDGAFSSLSNKGLIRDALDSIKRTRGRFQLIITGHDENYQNNFEYFPTLVEAREVNGQFMYADSKTRRIVEPEEVGGHYGSMGVMSLRVKPIMQARPEDT